MEIIQILLGPITILMYVLFRENRKDQRSKVSRRMVESDRADKRWKRYYDNLEIHRIASMLDRIPPSDGRDVGLYDSLRRAIKLHEDWTK